MCRQFCAYSTLFCWFTGGRCRCFDALALSIPSSIDGSAHQPLSLRQVALGDVERAMLECGLLRQAAAVTVGVPPNVRIVGFGVGEGTGEGTCAFMYLCVLTSMDPGLASVGGCFRLGVMLHCGCLGWWLVAVGPTPLELVVG